MKVFVATGTQLPFDRMIETIDVWAGETPQAEVFAQVGPSEYDAKHLESQGYVAPETFARKSREADVIVAHAGTGSIFTALELVKPLIVMPRRAKFGEHRNDHQVATVERFEGTPGVNVAYDETQLRSMLESIDELSRPDAALAHHARPELLRALSDFINDDVPLRKRDRALKFVRGLRP